MAGLLLQDAALLQMQAPGSHPKIHRVPRVFDGTLCSHPCLHSNQVPFYLHCIIWPVCLCVDAHLWYEQVLDLAGCKGLTNLPNELGKLTGLKSLYLRYAPRMGLQCPCAETCIA